VAQITQVMPEADARGVFGIIRKMGGEFQIEPSVKWIVVAEPLVCWLCGGSGRMGDANEGEIEVWPKCPDCNGTGLPDVEIVSEHYGVYKRIIVVPRGVVTIGAAVLISQRDGGEVVRPLIEVNRHDDHRPEGVYLLEGGLVTNITEQFGSQTVTPGMWAHPIQQSEHPTTGGTS